MLDDEAEEVASALGRICALRDEDEYLLATVNLTGAWSAVNGQYFAHLTRELAQREAWRRGRECALLQRVRIWQGSVSSNRCRDECHPTACKAVLDMEEEDVIQANELHKGDLCDGPFAALPSSRMLYSTAEPQITGFATPHAMSSIHRRFFSGSHAESCTPSSTPPTSSSLAATQHANDAEQARPSADVHATGMLQWRRRWRVFFFLWSKLVQEDLRAGAAASPDRASSMWLNTPSSVVEEMPYTAATQLLKIRRRSFDCVWQRVAISSTRV